MICGWKQQQLLSQLRFCEATGLSHRISATICGTVKKVVIGFKKSGYWITVSNESNMPPGMIQIIPYVIMLVFLPGMIQIDSYMLKKG